MYKDLSTYEQLLLAIEFHLKGSIIPKELNVLLGDELVATITNPSNKGTTDANREQTFHIGIN